MIMNVVCEFVEDHSRQLGPGEFISFEFVTFAQGARHEFGNIAFVGNINQHPLALWTKKCDPALEHPLIDR